jgi:hypothetical protein
MRTLSSVGGRLAVAKPAAEQRWGIGRRSAAVYRLRPEPCGLTEQSGRLADQVDEVLDRHALLGDLPLVRAVAAGGHRDGNDPGHVGSEKVGTGAQLHRFFEGFVSFPVQPGAEAARNARHEM